MVPLKELDGILKDMKVSSTSLLLDINGKLAQCGTTLFCEDESVNVVSGKVEGKVLN